MKKLVTAALFTATMLASVSSYAVVCTYTGPYGAEWTRNASGTRDVYVAKARAFAACQKGKRGNGRCVFSGCLYDEYQERGFRNYRY